jgi:hypothetical protein
MGEMNQNNSILRWKYLPIAIILLVIIILAILVFSGTQSEKTTGIPDIGIEEGILLAIIGLFAGFVGGIIGTGGCSVMLPAIHFWMGYPASIAVGTTLFAVIFTAISGGYGHLIRKNLDIRATLFLGISGILGVLVGSWLFTLLSNQVKILSMILGIAFLLPAIRMCWEGVGLGSKKHKEGDLIPNHTVGFIIFGFVIGTLTGIVGLGGGYALVPGLIYLFSAPVYITIGTSLATMIPLAVVGGGIKLAQGFVAIGAGLLLAGGTIIGAQIGAGVIKKFQPRTLKLIFGIIFLYVSLKFITSYFGIAIW